MNNENDYPPALVALGLFIIILLGASCIHIYDWSW